MNESSDNFFFSLWALFGSILSLICGKGSGLGAVGLVS